MATKESNLRRGKPRYFSACDVARVARNAVDDRGYTPESVLACTAKGLGFTYLGLGKDTAGAALSKDDVISEAVDLLQGAMSDFIRDEFSTSDFVRTETTKEIKVGFAKRLLRKLLSLSPLGKLAIAAAGAMYILIEARDSDDDCTCKPVEEWIDGDDCDCKT